MTEKAFTAKEIRGSYSEEKAREERYTEWVAHYIYRPLSFKVTPFFLRWGASPSNVTFIALLFVISLPFVAVFSPVAYLFVGLIAIVISVLDCVDGNIARLTGQASKSGGYFDFITDILCRVSVYFAIGLMINQAATTPALFADIATECLLIAAALAIIARMCRVYASSELFTDHAPKIEEKTNEAPQGWLGKYFFPFFSGLDWGLPFLVLFFGFFGLLHWVLVWLLLYSLLDFFHTQYSIFSKLR